VDVDVLMTHDVCGPGTIGIFKKEFGEDAKVWDREKVVIIPDHYIFTSDERANRNVDILRDFCVEQNIKYFYDIKDLSNFKVCLPLLCFSPSRFIQFIHILASLPHSARV
jgi:3-isopropylmalate/(R)-2-methylmalate dehydratase large subunit